MLYCIVNIFVGIIVRFKVLILCFGYVTESESMFFLVGKFQILYIRSKMESHSRSYECKVRIFKPTIHQVVFRYRTRQ